MSENTQTTVSNQDILQAIQAMDHKFTAANDDILSAVNTSFTDVAVELHDIKQDISGIKATMVTKEYLDDKLHDLRGDLTVVIRKEDRKVVALIDELRQTKVLSEPAAQRILALEPFPQG